MLLNLMIDLSAKKENEAVQDESKKIDVEHLTTLSGEEKINAMAKQIFAKYDRDSNGYLDQSELGAFIKSHNAKLGLPEPTQDDIQQLFGKLARHVPSEDDDAFDF